MQIVEEGDWAEIKWMEEKTININRCKNSISIERTKLKVDLHWREQVKNEYFLIEDQRTIGKTKKLVVFNQRASIKVEILHFWVHETIPKIWRIPKVEIEASKQTLWWVQRSPAEGRAERRDAKISENDAEVQGDGTLEI